MAEANGSNGNATSRSRVLLFGIALGFALGAAAGWFGNEAVVRNSVTVQEGVFSVKGVEEKTVYFPKPFAEVPQVQTEESSRGVRVIEVQATHFRVTCVEVMSVSNQPWKALGKLAR